MSSPFLRHRLHINLVADGRALFDGAQLGGAHCVN
jgi:hypothetical protein